MPQVNIRLSADELALLDDRAAEHGKTRSGFVRSLICDSPVASGLDEEDLVALLEIQARRGRVRAIELLLKRVKPEQSPSPVDSIVDQLAARRRSS